MDRQRIDECEANYLTAARALDELEAEIATETVRLSAQDPYRAREKAIAEIVPYLNETKAKVHIAKLRLEAAYREGKESK